MINCGEEFAPGGYNREQALKLSLIHISMMGEITVTMAEAIVASPARKLLLPVAQPHVELVGLMPQPLGALIRAAGQRLAEMNQE